MADEPNDQADQPQADQARKDLNEREKTGKSKQKKFKSNTSTQNRRVYVLVNDLASRLNLVDRTIIRYNVLLPINTRGIGLATSVTYRWMCDEFPNRIPNIQGFTVEALYRVSMLMVEYKLYLARRDLGVQALNPDGFQPSISTLFAPNLVQVVESIGSFPAPLYAIIGSIGKFKHGETMYNVFLPKIPSRPSAAQIRCDPFRICLFNLNNILTAYNAATATAEARGYFRRYSTVPGVIYNADNTHIDNIDDICSFTSATQAAVAQLNQDVFACQQAFTVLVSKFPNFLVPVKFTSEGSHIQLSNVLKGIEDIGVMHEGDDPPQIYPGEVEVRNLAPLKEPEALLGGYSYLGEIQPGPYAQDAELSYRKAGIGIETANVNWTTIFKSLIGK